MPGIDEALLRELLNTFHDEAAEHLQTINQSLLGLERDPSEKELPELLQTAFRAAHSLKGAARAVSMKEVEHLAHAMENILQQARDTGLKLDAQICDTLYETLDAIEAVLKEKVAPDENLMHRLRIMANLESDTVEDKSGAATTRQSDEPAEQEPAKTNGAKDSALAKDKENGVIKDGTVNGATDANAPVVTGKNAADETIRVSVGKLDDLMAQVGELLVSKISADQRLSDLEEIRSQFERWVKGWNDINSLIRSNGSDNRQRLLEAAERQTQVTQQIGQKFSTIDQLFGRDVLRLDMVTNSLQDNVRRVRMVPFSTITLLLERAVRDAARGDTARSASHDEHTTHPDAKQVEFSIEGEHIELDKKILEMLKDPLLHLLRNAVGHGIETPEERAAAGKPQSGKVTISVRQRGSEIYIAVNDDGRGFNTAALRERAISNGYRTQEDITTEDDAISIAFMPGISTAANVNAIMGRGVGLDVVRQQLEAVQGRINVKNQIGRGASIELIVPTSLAMTRGLLVKIGKEQYALPLLSIEKIIPMAGNFIVGGKPRIHVDGQSIPLVSLSIALERGIEATSEKPLAIILRVSDQRVALVVDDVITEQELAVKPLTKPLSRVRNVIGVALMGNGEPIIILNPADLIKATRQAAHTQFTVKKAEAQKEQKILQVLVVDDSITTRTLEKNILEAAGYKVITATDGLQALQRMKDNHPNIVVSDVQMPNMDGIALTKQIRESQEFNNLPVILVTSLESREDRERGLHAGANAYIVKRGFDQAELLATIQNLV